MAHTLSLMLYTSPLDIMPVLSWHAWWEYWIALWKETNVKIYTSWFAASLWSCLCLPAWAPYVVPSQVRKMGYRCPQAFQKTYCHKGFQLRRTRAFEEGKKYLSISVCLGAILRLAHLHGAAGVTEDPQEAAAPLEWQKEAEQEAPARLQHG